MPIFVPKATEALDKSTPQQQARAKLRESFLRTLFDLNGERCNIMNYERSLHQATFSGWNRDGSEVIVKNMTTPNREKVVSALLRTSDILAIQFDKEMCLQVKCKTKHCK